MNKLKRHKNIKYNITLKRDYLIYFYINLTQTCKLKRCFVMMIVTVQNIFVLMTNRYVIALQIN